ncbi:hypothetical protein N0H69_16375 [Yersinia alsatica]|uniref:Uncharacterized protein n=1 Tax=Yersinia alsatica TaxID=2890317 RepID=A0ABY5UL97_9GAMM|nr:hypothetical protein [Yersinia alsatica]UWM44251.1 hypothetical protein N0H69_16375 [Yersinia alsatica]CNK86920.1 subtilisin/kexin-like protease [Yersinia frederiksenii]CNK90292.1 subtilisin/kexin-like protease [Yersinia frederiksenii]
MKRFDVTYDIQNHKRKILSIIKSSEILIIRMFPGKDFAVMMLNAMTDNIEYQVVFTIASAEVYVVSVQSDANKINKLKENIAANTDVRFVGHGYKIERNKEPIIYTENLFIKFNEKLTENQCKTVTKQYNLIIKMND